MKGRARPKKFSSAGAGVSESKSVSVVPGGYPDEMDVILQYSDEFALTTTSAVGSQIYRGNDTFDPDLTGSGLQPEKRDSWAAQYVYQQVMWSSIEIKMQASNTAIPVYVVLVPVPDTAEDGTTTRNIEGLPYAQMRVCQLYGTNQRFSAKMSTRKMLGMRNVSFTTYGRSLVGTSPAASEAWYWMINQRTADGSTSTPVYYQVRLKYCVRFSKRVTSSLDLATRVLSNQLAFAKVRAAKRTPSYIVRSDQQSMAAGAAGAGSESKGDVKTLTAKTTDSKPQSTDDVDFQLIQYTPVSTIRALIAEELAKVSGTHAGAGKPETATAHRV